MTSPLNIGNPLSAIIHAGQSILFWLVLSWSTLPIIISPYSLHHWYDKDAIAPFYIAFLTFVFWVFRVIISSPYDIMSNPFRCHDASLPFCHLVNGGSPLSCHSNQKASASCQSHKIPPQASDNSLFFIKPQFSISPFHQLILSAH